MLKKVIRHATISHIQASAPSAARKPTAIYTSERSPSLDGLGSRLVARKRSGWIESCLHDYSARLLYAPVLLAAENCRQSTAFSLSR